MASLGGMGTKCEFRVKTVQAVAGPAVERTRKPRALRRIGIFGFEGCEEDGDGDGIWRCRVRLVDKWGGWPGL